MIVAGMTAGRRCRCCHRCPSTPPGRGRARRAAPHGAPAAGHRPQRVLASKVPMSVQRQEQPVREVSIEAMRDARLVRARTWSWSRSHSRSAWPSQATRGRHFHVHHHAHARARTSSSRSVFCTAKASSAPVRTSPTAASVARWATSCGSSSPRAPNFDAGRLQRNFYTTSSCGVCGNASLAAVGAHDALAERRRTLTVSGRADRIPVGPRARGPGRIPRDGRPACVLPVRRERQARRRPRGRRPAQRARQAGRRAAARGRTAAVAARAVPVRTCELRAAAEGRGRGHPRGRRGRRAFLARHRSRAAHGHPAGRLPARRIPSMSMPTASACNERGRTGATHPRDRGASTVTRTGR